MTPILAFPASKKEGKIQEWQFIRVDCHSSHFMLDCFLKPTILLDNQTNNTMNPKTHAPIDAAGMIATLLVILIALTLVGCVLLTSIGIFRANSIKPQSISPSELVVTNSPFELVVKEHGIFFNYNYIVFEDKPTKTRIFYYHDAMVILPPKKERE